MAIAEAWLCIQLPFFELIWTYVFFVTIKNIFLAKVLLTALTESQHIIMLLNIIKVFK